MEVACPCHRCCVTVERQTTIQHHAEDLHLVRHRQIDTSDGHGRYADDAKIYRLVTDNNDCLELQNDINNFNMWATNWQLKLNASKCNLVSYGRNIVHDFNYTLLSGTIINRTDNIKDLGVIFDSTLKFNKHIDDKVNKAYQNLGIIKSNFIHLTANCFILLYKSLVRSHLEYANSVWNKQYVENHKKIEKVQMRATKLVHGFSGLSYMQRLQNLQLPTLQGAKLLLGDCATRKHAKDC